jgi:hypothetical protein
MPAKKKEIEAATEEAPAAPIKAPKKTATKTTKAAAEKKTKAKKTEEPKAVEEKVEKKTKAEEPKVAEEKVEKKTKAEEESWTKRREEEGRTCGKSSGAQDGRAISTQARRAPAGITIPFGHQALWALGQRGHPDRGSGTTALYQPHTNPHPQVRWSTHAQAVLEEQAAHRGEVHQQAYGCHWPRGQAP